LWNFVLLGILCQTYRLYKYKRTYIFTGKSDEFGGVKHIVNIFLKRHESIKLRASEKWAIDSMHRISNHMNKLTLNYTLNCIVVRAYMNTRRSLQLHASALFLRKVCLAWHISKSVSFLIFSTVFVFLTKCILHGTIWSK